MNLKKTAIALAVASVAATPVIAAALASAGYLALPVLTGIAFLSGLCLHLLLARGRRA